MQTPPLKIFVFSWDRYHAITTSQYFRDYEHTVLCHSMQQAANFKRGGRVYGDVLPTLHAKGLAYQRNAALDLMQAGQWAVFFVDDLIDVTHLPEAYHDTDFSDTIDITPANQREYKQVHFKTPCDAGQFLDIAMQDIAHAEARGYALVGYSLTDNPLFRRRHYSYWSLADGRCWLVKKTHLRFDTNAQLIDDTCFTALNLQAFGGVVVNNWLLPRCHRYTAGAYGTMAERMEQKKNECAYLVRTYPDFIAYADKAGWPEGTHVRIRQRKINFKQTNLLF